MKQKIFISIAILSLLSLAVFVTANSQQGTQGQITFEVSLNEGWNLVASGGFAHGPGIESDSQIQSSDLEAIFYYSPLQKKYIQLFPYPTTEAEQNQYSALQDEEERLEGNFQMESRAYWVYSNKAGNLKFTTDDVLPFDQRQLRAGWNFVSITSEMLDKSLGSFKGSCDIQKFTYYDSSYNRWETSTPETLADKIPAGANIGWYDIVMFEQYQLGEGVLFKVSLDCKLANSGSNIAPPQIPDSPSNPSCIKEVIILKESFPEEFIHLNATSNEFSWLDHEKILEEFYKTHEDNYDFLVVAPQEANFQSHYSLSFDSNIAGTNSPWTATSPYTSRLMSFTLFDYYSYYKSVTDNNMTPQFLPAFLYTIYHEMAHHWCCYLNGVDAVNNPHWSDNVDLFGGSLNYVDIMGYKEWVIQNGENHCIENGDTGVNWKFSNLTLYLMGLVGKESVSPIKVQHSTSGKTCGDNPSDVQTETITIQDVIAQNGERIPNAQQSQKEFNVAFVDIVPYGQEIDYDYINYLKEYMRSDEWAEATSYKSKITFCK